MFINKRIKVLLFTALAIMAAGGLFLYSHYDNQNTKVKDVVCLNMGDNGPAHIEKSKIKAFCDLMRENTKKENQYEAELTFGSAWFEVYYKDGSQDSFSMTTATVWTEHGQYHATKELYDQVLSMFDIKK